MSKCIDCNELIKGQGLRCKSCSKKGERNPLYNKAPWNKNTKGVMKENSGSFKKGEHLRADHPNWKGGKVLGANGKYWYILKPEHPNCMSDGYVAEHRLVIEKALGRYLGKNEDVHHKNRNTKDNRVENLDVMLKSEHGRMHSLERWRTLKTRRDG